MVKWIGWRSSPFRPSNNHCKKDEGGWRGWQIVPFYSIGGPGILEDPGIDSKFALDFCSPNSFFRPFPLSLPPLSTPGSTRMLEVICQSFQAMPIPHPRNTPRLLAVLENKLGKCLTAGTMSCSNKAKESILSFVVLSAQSSSRQTKAHRSSLS